MSSAGAAPRAAIPVSSARAEASRRNGARSRGPKTPEGKARSARNALKHGMRAQKYVVLPQEDAAAFQAHEAALNDELAPDGVLQNILVQRIARAAWRLERAERLEVEVLEFRGYGGARPGLALIRDGNGTRSVETLLRYRGAATAELMRALRTLKALQAEQEAVPARAAAAEPAPVLMFEPKGGRAEATCPVPDRNAARGAARERNPIPEPRRSPIEPEACAQAGEAEPAPPPARCRHLTSGSARARTNQPEQVSAGAPGHRGAQPNEPGLARREAAAGPGARRTAPGATLPPPGCPNPAAAPAQLARSTP
jgi:hypothetical protein